MIPNISNKALFFAGIGFTFYILLKYFDSSRSCPLLFQTPVEDRRIETNTEKPLILLWFWPYGQRFAFNSCRVYYNIDSCELTDDRSLYDKAQAVIFFHLHIEENATNLPKEPRPYFQRWIWFNLDSPENTVKMPGLETIFNMTLNYRKDSDIVARYPLTIRDEILTEKIVLPDKNKTVCWIVSHSTPLFGTEIIEKFYHELSQHINVDVFGTAYTGVRLEADQYYQTIASCKFYLLFENSINIDYITEKVNAPLSTGTVPVVFGPPRANYEMFFPSDSFIHIHDFPDAKALAEHLLYLDKDEEAYMRYFEWRKYFIPQQMTLGKEFITPVCYACQHMANDNYYHEMEDLNQWFFEWHLTETDNESIPLPVMYF